MIYALAPSHNDLNVWAGTDDGFIHVTRDGGQTWKNITPPAMTPWGKIAQLDASHFDDADGVRRRQRLRAGRSCTRTSYRTHDGGETWTGDRAAASERPGQHGARRPGAKGLLFAGTERQSMSRSTTATIGSPLR